MNNIFLINYDGTLDSFNDSIDKSIKHLKEEIDIVDRSNRIKTESELANDRTFEKLEDLKVQFNKQYRKLSKFSHVYFSNIDVTNTSIRRYSGYTLRPVLEPIGDVWKPVKKIPIVLPFSIKVLLFILLLIVIIIIIIGCYCYFMEIDILTPSSTMAGI